MRLAIEMDGDSPRYGQIHRAGCQDLSDPLALGDPGTTFEVVRAVEVNVGSDWVWHYSTPDEVLADMAPCARNARNDFDGTPYWED